MSQQVARQKVDTDVYRGNSLLKRVGTPVEITPERREEYKKCAVDPIYFTRKYVKIIHVDYGLVPFNLYDYQEDMMNSMNHNRYTVITTARQTGKSTTTVAFILWYILFHGQKTVALLANKGDTAREILGRIQLAYMHLPKWLQQGIVEWNKGSLELENDSRVLAGATSASSIRGYTINLLFIDEAAFIENWDEFFTSVFPTISSGKTTKVVLVSTPNGLNHFHKLWKNANEGRNNYHPIKVMWYDVPGRDEEWKNDILANMDYDYEKFAQEHEVEFLGSSGTLISGAKLKQLTHYTPLRHTENLKTYLEPEQNHVYVGVVDVSRGKGLDYSAFHVVDVTTMPYRQVATFRDNMISPVEYCEVLHRVGRYFNNVLYMIELNDIGGQVADMMYMDYEYEDLIYTVNKGSKGKQITTDMGKNVDRGVRTTKSVKAVGCSMLKMLIEQDQMLVVDEDTIDELTTFSKKKGSYAAEPGKNDDLVMGLVLFAWLSSQQYFKELTDINTLAELRERNSEQLSENILPFIISDGNENFDDQGSLEWFVETDEEDPFSDAETWRSASW